MAKPGRPGCRDAVLAAMPGTLTEIHSKCSVVRSSVVRMLRILRDSNDCHVTAWKRSVGRGPIMAVYTAGPGADKKPLRQLLCKVYAVRYAKRNPEMIALNQASKRAKYWADKARTKPQSWLSALGV